MLALVIGLVRKEAESPRAVRFQIERGAEWTDRASATGTATLLGELPRQPR